MQQRGIEGNLEKAAAVHKLGLVLLRQDVVGEAETVIRRGLEIYQREEGGRVNVKGVVSI